MSLDFTDKTVLVTGGASGLGYACAQAFLNAGGKVAVADISRETVAKAVDELKPYGEVMGVVADVTDAKAVDAMVATVVNQWGRLDVALNNAGISSSLQPLADTPEELFDRVIAVNLKGVWLCMRAELQQMQKQGKGSIVNMASALSLTVFGTASSYVASKFGVAGLTRTAAVEYATSGIRINAVCPGNVATPLFVNSVPEDQVEVLSNLHAMKRLGTTEEVASAVLWIASDAASFNTGTLLPVDGGWNAY